MSAADQQAFAHQGYVVRRRDTVAAHEACSPPQSTASWDRKAGLGSVADLAVTTRLADKRRPSLAYRAMRALWRFLTDASYRGIMRLRWHKASGVYQPDDFTMSNRYPRIFSFVQSELGSQSEARILSFGCSTGEEVFSLRGYFARAVIKGIDINPRSIAICQERLRRIGDLGIAFESTSSTVKEETNSYDAIFCMAVLRHGALGAESIARCDDLIPFDKFACTVDDFTRCLKPGGLLIVRHSNFRLCDAPAGATYETILKVPHHGTQRTPIFGPDNRLVAGAVYEDTVFRKLRA